MPTQPPASESTGAAGRACPRAFLLCGPSLAGKSGLAARLSTVTGAVVVSTDPIDAARGLPSDGEGRPAEARAEAWRVALSRLREAVASGRDAVLDDTLCLRSLRDEARAAATEAGGSTVLVVVATTRDEILRRWEEGKVQGKPVPSLGTLMTHLEGFERPAREEEAIVLSDGEAASEWLGTLAGGDPSGAPHPGAGA